MIYRVSYYCEIEGSHGYGYFGNKQEAEKAIIKYNKNARKPSCDLSSFRTPKTKHDILVYLNALGGHNDNG